MPEEMTGHDSATGSDKDNLFGNKRAGAFRQGLLRRQKKLDTVLRGSGLALGKRLCHSNSIIGAMCKRKSFASSLG